MKKNKGITLIALVITIIILLILAGVAIAQLTDSGLFGKAKLAKQTQENSEAIENDTLKQYENAIDARITGETRDTTYCTTAATTSSTASVTNPCVVIENYCNGDNWYRIWSDGWIEQGGKSTGGNNSTGATTTFLKQFKNTNYTLTTSDAISSHSNQASCALVVTSKTATGFDISSSWVTNSSWNWSTLTFNWYACGY